ncbi:MAG: pitrilysin family protein [Melioribacteraceae bacterium]|jgi:zinc protease|nr:pitrilysin family protein [Melioribacteraceae bacterium]
MKTERNSPPQTNGTIEFHLPKFNNFVLDNGLEVFFVQKNNLPLVQLNMLVNAGSKFDPINKSGLAYLTSLLIDEGAGEFNSLQLDDEFESLGSIFGVSTDNDNIHLSLLTLKENLSRSLELFSLVYQSPNFTEHDFIREQKKLASTIIQHQDDPSYIATSNFDNIIFDGTNYKNPIIGNVGDVNSISNYDITEFYKKHFTPLNTKLVVVGNIELKELNVLLNKHFNSTNRNKIEEQNDIIPITQKQQFYFIHKENAAQSEIRIGHLSDKRNETDYFAKVIANSILGGQFSSRLNLNLREDKGFTYGINSAFSYSKNAGHFEIATSVNGKDTGEAIAEINKEITGLKSEIKKDEIEFTKSYLVKRFPAMFETYSQIAHHLSTMLKYKLSEDYFDNYIEKIIACSMDEIEKIAKEKIISDELIYLIVGEREMVLPQLKKITDLKIVELDVNGKVINQ